jgi:hypothetical protein
MCLARNGKEKSSVGRGVDIQRYPCNIGSRKGAAAVPLWGSGRELRLACRSYPTALPKKVRASRSGIRRTRITEQMTVPSMYQIHAIQNLYGVA